MAYSELVKSFERIRNYMREFYVYGFKSRDEYGMKSARSYDNERRRIESWLGDYMSFHQESSGKRVFLSMDSRRVPCNPLYKAFKAKSFTDKDITLHFYIMDLLADGSALSSKEIVDRINDDYLSHFNGDFSLDESTVRKKLKEYEDIGLLQSEKIGREVIYRRTDNAEIDLDSWADALAYYSEADPLGVVGSFLLDKLKHTKDIFRFKHHYILHALDSDILCVLLLAINERRAVELSICSLRNGRDYQRTVCPLKIYSSTQSGRQYLLGYHYRGRHLIFFRLDAIKKVTAGSVEKQYTRFDCEEITMLKLFDTVTLKNDDPETGVKAGTEGTIVDVLGNGKAFTVEFFDEDGNTIEASLYTEYTPAQLQKVETALTLT